MRASSKAATASLSFLYDAGDRAYAGAYESTRSGVATSAVFALLVNDHGDVLGLADGQGNQFARYTYGVFGEVLEATSRSTASITGSLAAEITAANPLRFAGYCYDSWSSTYYLQARYYDPPTAQFLSKDPFISDGEESAYQYCTGDPVQMVDPDGEAAMYTDEGHATAADAATYAYEHAKSKKAKNRLRGLARHRWHEWRNMKRMSRIVRQREFTEREAERQLRYSKMYAAAPWVLGIAAAVGVTYLTAGAAGPYVGAWLATAEGGAAAATTAGGVAATAAANGLDDEVADGQAVLNTVSNCFPAGTPVRTAAGLVAIDAIRPGTLVLSRDERTGETSLKRVTRTMVHRATELVHVRTAEDTVTATPNHPFRVVGRGWVAAGELAAGDTLYLADGGRASILSVTREKLASPVDVYNLEVEDFHTYFVASAGVWVHNCGGEEAATGTRELAKKLCDWIGENPNRFQSNQSVGWNSADGLRTVRFDIFEPFHHGAEHMHVEELVDGVWQKSGALFPN
jgi:RHS repeat-associated protein